MTEETRVPERLAWSDVDGAEDPTLVADGAKGPGEPGRAAGTPPGPKSGRRRATPRTLLVTFLAVLAGVVAGTLAANTLGGSGGSEPMGVWMSDYGSNYVSLSHDVGRVRVDAARSNVSLPTVRADCVRLVTDVHTAQAEPPMPDPTLEATWSSIVRNLRGGAQTCVSGIDRQSDALLQQSGEDFDRASSAYLRLIQQVDRSR